MDIDALRYFLAVVQARSMRGAADDLHIAQSALSRQIAKLEKELGTPLLMRLPRGVKPTEAGQLLARKARSILDQVASVHDDIGSLKGLNSGRIAISAIEPVVDGLLLACMHRLLKAHPAISFDIRVGNSPQVTALLREGIVELAIAYNVPYDRDLVIRTEVQMPLVALFREGHELKDRQSCHFADLARWPLVLPPAGSPTRVLIEEAARREESPLERIALESDSVMMRLGFLENTDAVAIVASISGRMVHSGRGLRALPIESPLLAAGSLQLLSGRGHQLSRAAAEFERLVRSAMRHL